MDDVNVLTCHTVFSSLQNPAEFEPINLLALCDREGVQVSDIIGAIGRDIEMWQELEFRDQFPFSLFLGVINELVQNLSEAEWAKFQSGSSAIMAKLLRQIRRQSLPEAAGNISRLF